MGAAVPAKLGVIELARRLSTRSAGGRDRHGATLGTLQFARVPEHLRPTGDGSRRRSGGRRATPRATASRAPAALTVASGEHARQAGRGRSRNPHGRRRSRRPRSCRVEVDGGLAVAFSYGVAGGRWVPITSPASRMARRPSSEENSVVV